MTKVKSFDKNLYPCIADAIYEIMDKHLLVAANNSIYGAEALEEVCFFLAENDIPHSYTILPAYAGAEYDEVIALVWFDSGKAYGELWFSRGKAFPRKHYRVTMNVSAEDEEEISEWISNVTDIEILDWGVDEL